MPCLRLILVRHGQSQWNLENRFTGWWDVDLTEKGVAEARAAGALLADKGMLPTRRLHLAPDPRDQDAAPRARSLRAAVDPRDQGLAAQRAALRRADRARQGRDRGQARRRAGQDLAPQLRHAAAGARRRVGVRPGSRPALRRDRDPRDREPQATRSRACCPITRARSCRSSRPARR